jgi:hypothetical protein
MRRQALAVGKVDPRPGELVEHRAQADNLAIQAPFRLGEAETTTGVVKAPMAAVLEPAARQRPVDMPAVEVALALEVVALNRFPLAREGLAAGLGLEQELGLLPVMGMEV